MVEHYLGTKNHIPEKRVSQQGNTHGMETIYIYLVSNRYNKHIRIPFQREKKCGLKESKSKMYDGSN